MKRFPSRITLLTIGMVAIAKLWPPHPDEILGLDAKVVTILYGGILLMIVDKLWGE